MYERFTNFRSYPCKNLVSHRPIVCTFSHFTKVKSNKVKSNKVKSNKLKDNYVLGKVDIDDCLPTSREKDIKDIGLNGDSFHDPKLTKEQLDLELDEYNRHRDYKKRFYLR